MFNNQLAKFLKIQQSTQTVLASPSTTLGLTTQWHLEPVEGDGNVFILIVAVATRLYKFVKI